MACWLLEATCVPWLWRLHRPSHGAEQRLCVFPVTSPSRRGVDRFSSSMTLGHLDHRGSPPHVSHSPPFNHIYKALFPCQTCHGLGCGLPSPHFADALGFCLSFFPLKPARVTCLFRTSCLSLNTQGGTKPFACLQPTRAALVSLRARGGVVFHLGKEPDCGSSLRTSLYFGR